ENPLPPESPIAVAQTSLPSLSLTATTVVLPLRSPIVQTRPPATTAPAYPLPSPSAFQTSGGASPQWSSNPFAGETPSRLGPAHCGQVPDPHTADANASPITSGGRRRGIVDSLSTRAHAGRAWNRFGLDNHRRVTRAAL